MPESLHVFAGECTATFEGRERSVHRGRAIVVVKPDRTVLVHDASGYQPVSWLTRADAVTIERDPDAPGDGRGSDGPTAGASVGITARAGERTLRVVCHDLDADAAYPVTPAGDPVGTHPRTGGTLVRAGGAVHDIDSGDRYPLVAGATVLDDRCERCGLPTMGVERGAVFEVCIDRSCESLDAAVRERFDGAWGCPDCESPLRVIRRRGRLLVGCDAYPDCETAFTIPSGVVVDDCACGLPVFETATGRRCLDGTCERFGRAASEGSAGDEGASERPPDDGGSERTPGDADSERSRGDDADAAGNDPAEPTAVNDAAESSDGDGPNPNGDDERTDSSAGGTP